MTIRQNFEIHAGDTLKIDVIVMDDSGYKNLTDATVYYGISQSEGGDVIFEKHSNGNGITITDAPNGEYRITLSPSDTKPLLGHHFHESKIVDSADNRITVLTGQLTVKSSILK